VISGPHFLPTRSLDVKGRTRHAIGRRAATVRALSATAASCLVLVACGSDGGSSDDASAGATSISVAVYGMHASYWPLYAAQDSGCFVDNDLEVDLVVPQAGSGITQAVVSGSVQLGIGTPDGFILAQSEGQGVHAVAALQNNPIGSLLVPPGSDFPENVRGDLVAVSNEKSGDAYLTRKLLADAGLAEGEYSFVNAGGTPDRAAALSGGGVQAALIGQPQDIPLIAKGYERVGLAADVVADFAWQWAVAQDEWAEANPEALADFLGCVTEATAWWYDPANADAAVALLADTSGADLAAAQATYDLWQETDAFSADLRPSQAAYEGTLDFMNSVDLLDGRKAATFDEFIDTSYLEDAE
jgi:ABC-type nitrate/sulfonate/bicarbonate transport system substrate-binding protein